ncbi:uncharacterized protein LOC129950504 [Eupeodes corollae]|uniref:uncharacterized protein LOC129950504 n=1 Tax=Eupeodes corollae TaxID=290404 RepID=UPI002491FC1D|nr:uncharacterized protein LOC129950504 [Eupeodes corollae]
MIDRFSRWPEAIPLQEMSAETVAAAFYNRWVSRFGSPIKITTDQGTQFESALFSALMKLIGTTRVRTAPYHPASNGLVERWHRSLKTALMCHEKTNWVDALPTVLMGLRTTYKEDIKASAAEMLYGTSLTIPGEFFVNQDTFSDPQIFVQKHREVMRKFRASTTSNHATNTKLFVSPDLYKSSHVFLRRDCVTKAIGTTILWSSSYGRILNVSTERLKPAYISLGNSTAREPSLPTSSDHRQTPSQVELNQLSTTKIRSILKKNEKNLQIKTDVQHRVKFDN